ncbi:cell envelope biogenesis protein TolA [Enterobacter hormaechei]|nr:cell envelope biogenesis protein TolA [Enterobacter hormaechei]
MLLTEIEAAKQVRDGALPSPYKFTNMWLVNLRITGTGLAYRANDKEHVWRDPQIYLNAQFLERCVGVPVIIDHPEGGKLDAIGTESRIVGTVMLPYLRGDEVWAVCRVYGKEIIDYIEKEKEGISTSPSVIFCGDSGCADVPNATGDDNNFLIEGVPYLIDHIALVPLGVWDKDGQPTGVEVTSQDEGERLAAMVTAVMAEALKPANATLDKLSERLTELERLSAA